MFKINNLTSFEKNPMILYGSPNLLNSNQKTSNDTSKNQTNRKKRNVKKPKPFLITEIESENYQKVKIVINACSFCDEYMMPVWCPKNMYIKFRVEGKWRIDKLYDYTDSKGMPSSHSAGFNYGALVGRIGTGEKFMVSDETTVLVKEEGPLFLRQNLPKRMQLSPQGKLEVSVYDGIYTPIEEINNKIGWIENGITEDNTPNKKDEFEGNEKNNPDNNSPNSPKKSTRSTEKEFEQNLTVQVNNLRMNPSMFYEKYISFNSSLIWTKKFLDKLPKEGKSRLAAHEDCYKFLDDYFKLPNQKQFRKNLYKINVSENLKKLDNDISYFICDKFKATAKVKCKITQRDNPMDIIMQFLLDKKFRPFIFSNRSQFLVIKTYKKFFNKSNMVVIAIILDKDYSLEEP